MRSFGQGQTSAVELEGALQGDELLNLLLLLGLLATSAHAQHKPELQTCRSCIYVYHACVARLMSSRSRIMFSVWRSQ